MRELRGKTIWGKTLVLTIAIVFGFSQLVSAQDKPDYEKHIDWAANDTGAPDCPWLYATSDLQGCLAIGLATGNNDGNRSCVISLAIAAAKTGDPRLAGVAYGYVLLTQCHNPDARKTLINAGPEAVVEYLRSF